MKKAKEYLQQQGRDDAASYVSEELKEFIWTAIGVVVIMVLMTAALYVQMRPHP